MVVQPGAGCQLPTLPLRVGPQLFIPAWDESGFLLLERYEPYERFVRLEPGADPEAWVPSAEPPEGTYAMHDQACDQRKVGGTPDFLQGDEWPPGEGWRFAFQFDAGWAGQDLADAAACYGFVRNDGTGAFLWQSH